MKSVIKFQRLSSVTLLGFVLGVSSVFPQSNRGRTPAQAKIEVLAQELSSPDVEQRRDAVLRLGAMHTVEASRAALPALNDSSPIVRATAAKAILSLDPDESVQALGKLVTDKDQFVRREAIYALGLTHSRSATAIVSAALQNDKIDGVRAAAAVALGDLRDETAVPLLSSVLSPTATRLRNSKIKQERNVFVLRAAATSLGLIKSRAGTQALIDALSNQRYPDDVKREAAVSLGLIGDPAGANALRVAAHSRDPYLALIAQQSLRKVSP